MVSLTKLSLFHWVLNYVNFKLATNDSCCRSTLDLTTSRHQVAREPRPGQQAEDQSSQVVVTRLHVLCLTGRRGKHEVWWRIVTWFSGSRGAGAGLVPWSRRPAEIGNIAHNWGEGCIKGGFHVVQHVTLGVNVRWD